MRIAIGADHGGVRLKERLVELLDAEGHAVDDLGTFGTEAVDYPDIAGAVATQVADGRADRGVLVCGSGIGVSIAANKVDGVRAALAHDVTTARLSRAHNDANVVCFGERVTGAEVAVDALRAWLTTPFDGGRHSGRVAKIASLEATPDPVGDRA